MLKEDYSTTPDLPYNIRLGYVKDGTYHRRNPNLMGRICKAGKRLAKIADKVYKGKLENKVR